MKRFISKLSGVGGKEMKRGQTLTGESSICFCWVGGGEKGGGGVAVVSVTGVKGEDGGVGWCESKQDTSLYVLPLSTPSIIVIQARNEKLHRQGSVSLRSREKKKKEK